MAAGGQEDVERVRAGEGLSPARRGTRPSAAFSRIRSAGRAVISGDGREGLRYARAQTEIGHDADDWVVGRVSAVPFVLTCHRELQREKVWSRLHLVPLLLAEGDRDAYRREQAALEREKEIMKNVKGWEVRGPSDVHRDWVLADGVISAMRLLSLICCRLSICRRARACTTSPSIGRRTA